MDKLTVKAQFQMLDNYISKFSLDVFRKISPSEEFEINANIGFRIINIEKKETENFGQIELNYNIDMKIAETNVAKISIIINGLFNGDVSIDIKDFEQMLKINGATTLSHLSRAYINSTTSLSGMPPIIMPLINFNEFFKNAIEEKTMNKNKN